MISLSDAKAELNAVNTAIAKAVILLRDSKPTIDAFLKESELMASAGPVLAPSLFNNSERQAVEALLKPIYAAARSLVEVYDDQTNRGLAALEKVNG